MVGSAIDMLRGSRGISLEVTEQKKKLKSMKQNP
jgi:hypothetical protein